MPRIGLDTDQRTIPNEIGVLGVAVHLDKGCYRGQETVARVHTLGRPPRRLVLLHLDGTAEALPGVGARVWSWTDARSVSSAARPVTTNSARSRSGLVKRNTPVDATLVAEGIAAAQEVLVDPEIGLHVRPLRP